jgi:hypothetical protein
MNSQSEINIGGSQDQNSTLTNAQGSIYKLD